MANRCKKSAYELERDANIRRNEELLRRLGINMREKRFQENKKIESSGSESDSESDHDWKPEEVKKVVPRYKPPLKQVAYTPGVVEHVVEQFEREEEERKAKRKSKFPNKPEPKKHVKVVTNDLTFGKAKQKSKKQEIDCFDELKDANFSSDEETKERKISYEEYLQKREDTELMEDEIAMVSRFIRQQSLDEKLEVQDSKTDIVTGRTRRHLKHVDYTEETLVTEDSYVYCEECDELHLGDCPAFGELSPLDESGMNECSISPIPIPKQLTLKTSSIPKAGLGIFATDTLAIRTRLGPYKGILIRGSVDNLPNESGYLWQIKRGVGKTVWYIDGEDLTQSNWLRYVNCARHEDEQNLVAYQYKGRIYYRSYKVILPGEELLVYYGDQYAKQLGIEETVNPVETVTEREVVTGVRVYRRKDKDRPYKCTQCNSSYTSKGNLATHSRLHTGVNLHRCEVCPKVFTVKKNLTRHIRTHTGEKPFECVTCHKRFIQISNLTTHTRIHTGEKPYECDTCHKKFNRSSYLTTHTRIHTGEKPYECDTCHRRFTQLSCLTTHTRIHTGEKPYSCVICKKAFNDSCNRNKHQKIHSKSSK